MSDIFLSYKSEDRELLKPLVKAIEENGMTVFWDKDIPAGQRWRDYIHSEISKCICVLVVWSKSSVKSEWVEVEATEGQSRKNLFPVTIDNTKPPFGFDTIQVANLSSWKGEENHAEFNKFIKDLNAFIYTLKVRAEESQTARPINSQPSFEPQSVSSPAIAPPQAPNYNQQSKSGFGAYKKIVLGGITAVLIASMAVFGYVQYTEKLALENAKQEMELKKQQQEAMMLAEKVKEEARLKAEAEAKAQAEEKMKIELAAKEQEQRILDAENKKKASVKREADKKKAASRARKQKKETERLLAIAQQNTAQAARINAQAKQKAAQNARIRAEANQRAKQQQAQNAARQRAKQQQAQNAARQRAAQQQATAARQQQPANNNTQGNAFAEKITEKAINTLTDKFRF